MDVGSCQETLVPLSVKRSAEFRRNRLIPSQSVFGGAFDNATQTSTVKARLKARGDPDPDLLSLAVKNQASATFVGYAFGTRRCHCSAELHRNPEAATRPAPR